MRALMLARVFERAVCAATRIQPCAALLTNTICTSSLTRSHDAAAHDKIKQSPVALVTGGASGIGRAACLEFAKRGIRVVINDVNEAGAHETLKQLPGVASGGEPGSVCKGDVSDEGDVKRLMAHIRSTYGRLDYAFDNAGIAGEGGMTADHPTDDFDKVMAVNTRSVFLCLKHQIPLMLETADNPAIVVTSSVAGVIGAEGAAAYVASKHAVIGLMRTAAAEYGPMGLRVNAICPAATDTPLQAHSASKVPRDSVVGRAMAGESYPLRRIATAQEAAEVAVWLCTSATFVTGQALAVDGGFTSCV